MCMVIRTAHVFGINASEVRAGALVHYTANRVQRDAILDMRSIGLAMVGLCRIMDPAFDADGRRVTFHSMRHAVADTLKQANVDTKFINEHQGHSQRNIDLDRYGKNYDAEIIYENVTKRIIYESSRGRKIDFSGLKVDWKRVLK